MNQLKIVFLVFLSWGLCLSPRVVQSAKPNAAASDASQTELLRVLRIEIVGSADRRAALAEIMRSGPDAARAHWQAGFVRDGDGWQSFDATSVSTPEREKLERYHARRAVAPATVAGQSELADWCRDQGLAEQERAHLNSVLLLAPDSNPAPVLQRLGFRQVGGRWLSREQLVEWRESNRQAEASLKRFGPGLERIARQMSGSNRQQVKGLAALKEFNDPAAIPALELTLASRNESAALAVVETLSRFDDYEASLALAKMGVWSTWPGVRTAAATALRSRPFEHFVPQLVGLLSTPIERAVEVQTFGWQSWGRMPGTRWRAQSGVLEYTYIMKREMGDQFQVARFQTLNSLLDDYLAGTRREELGDRRDRMVSGLQNELYNNALERGRTDALRAFRDDVNRKDREVARQNEQIAELNQRVGEVLATVSSEASSAEPRQWWSWWNQFNELGSSSAKPIVRIVDEQETVGDLRPSFEYVGAAVTSARGECFAAGTPVWTQSGTVPIESLRIGDLVLAKNVETGELEFKPVFETTRQPPKQLQTLRFNDESIVCTGGHRFWISGTGWVKARDLAPASLVHTATGNTPVWSAKKGETAETYNLVIADFHTYFVGKTGVLCQDVVLPRPTNKVVPGLDRSQVAADKR